MGTMGQTTEVISIGSDRQLFLDDLLIDRMEGAGTRMHAPVPREVAFRFDQPWEGNVSWCPVVMDDEDRYRMWYRSEHIGNEEGGVSSHSFTAYAESPDGIHWDRPNLGLEMFGNSTENNICIHSPDMKNVAVFIDNREGVSDAEKYKAVGRWTKGRPSRIFGMVSSDGVCWKKVQEEALIVAPDEDPQFDSPLSAFWDGRTNRYVLYIRGWGPGGAENRIRAIRMTTSEDFINWTPFQYIEIDNLDGWPYHLYTNSGHPYYRAPYYLMFPKRLMPNRTFLSDWPYEGQSDVLLLSSRDAQNFHFSGGDAFLRPGPDIQNWHERSIFIAPRVVPTVPGEMSMYSVQNYRTDSAHIRRFSLREDGFVSTYASDSGGALITNPLAFSGKSLEINYSTSGAGVVRVGLMDEHCQSLDGFEATASEIFGDEISRTVRWNGSADVGSLSEKPIRIRFELAEADLFSFRFA
tara:strand:- start:1381 stop:2775 length:1395 start_codon:yes stop_codon:yes gene_type:complete